MLVRSYSNIEGSIMDMMRLQDRRMKYLLYYLRTSSARWFLIFAAESSSKCCSVNRSWTGHPPKIKSTGHLGSTKRMEIVQLEI